MCKFSADRLFISADIFNEYTLQKAAYVAAQTVGVTEAVSKLFENCAQIARPLSCVV